MFGIAFAVKQNMEYTINISPDLLKKLQAMADERGISLELLIIENMKHDLKRWEHQISYINKETM